MSRELTLVLLFALCAIPPHAFAAEIDLPRDATDATGEETVAPPGELPSMGYLGVGVKNDPDLRGLVVTDVVAGSPAQTAGLAGGDVIAEINGVTVDEIVGKTYRDLSPDTADAAEPLLRDLIERGQSVRNLEVRARPPTDPDVEHIYLLSMEPARDPEGRILGYSTAVQDVTELRVAEETAARRLQELEILYAHAPVGLCHLDPELRILTLNARFAQLSDLPRADQIGRMAGDVLPGAIARQIVPQAAYVVRSGGSIANIEIHGHLPHGGSALEPKRADRARSACCELGRPPGFHQR